jgi:hypothetical protein
LNRYVKIAPSLGIIHLEIACESRHVDLSLLSFMDGLCVCVCVCVYKVAILSTGASSVSFASFVKQITCNIYFWFYAFLELKKETFLS